jgi:hypothetical protein
LLLTFDDMNTTTRSTKYNDAPDAHVTKEMASRTLSASPHPATKQQETRNKNLASEG